MPAVQGFIAALLLGAAADGSAVDAQPREYRDQVGEWQVTTFSPRRCTVKRQFSTGTFVLVGHSEDGRADLTAVSRAWPAPAAGSYRLALIQNGRPRRIAAEDDGSLHGLSRSTSEGAGLLAQLEAGGSLEVRGPDGALLDRVDLRGIGPALARLRPCVTEIATEANFPLPPAPPPPPPPPGRGGKVRPARAKANLYQLFSEADYPAAAIRDGHEGATTFRLDVDRDGRVAACSITGTSGSAILDVTTCQLLTVRARFTPALDSDGKPTADSVAGRIVWRLPKPEPEPPPDPPQ